MRALTIVDQYACGCAISHRRSSASTAERDRSAPETFTQPSRGSACEHPGLFGAHDLDAGSHDTRL